MHDPVTRGDHINILEGCLSPIDKVKSIVIAPVLNGAVLLEGVWLETSVFHGQRVVNNELGWHYRIHLGRVSSFRRDSVAKTGEVNQCGLTKYVMTDHSGWEPGKV